MFVRCVGFLEDTGSRDCWKSGSSASEYKSRLTDLRCWRGLSMKLSEQAEQQDSEEIGTTSRTDQRQARVVPDERWVVPRWY